LNYDTFGMWLLKLRSYLLLITSGWNVTTDSHQTWVAIYRLHGGHLRRPQTPPVIAFWASFGGKLR